ncbi:MAG: O-antigen ligase family protein [Verrucomicrobiae bacterium]|nr:O-antigen ligase family protein [Verrucomicrobiae bacterium]
MDTGVRTPPLHHALDAVSGAVLLGMTVWAPWAFGGTVPWSRAVLYGAGGLLGVLLLGKQLVRLQHDFSPERWWTPRPAGRWALRGLAVVQLLLADFLLIGWLNPRATLRMGLSGVDLDYSARTPTSWLPTTYDAPATLRTLLAVLALSLTFWAARDWLLGRSRRERHSSSPPSFPPARLRRLLWTLCASSAVLAVASIAQRWEGSDRLLWMLRSLVPWQRHPAGPNTADQIWGPFPVRAAGAAYFNLIWPVALGFWWTLRHEALRRSGASHRIGDDASVMLLPATGLMILCPFLSGGRSGALVALGLMGAVLLVFAAGRWPEGRLRRGLGAAGLAVLLGVAAILAGTPVGTRFDARFADAVGNRADVQEIARRMAADAGWLGTGAGSFGGLSALYRAGPEDRWLTYAHNDWMEIRITLGLGGLALAGLMVVLLAVLRGSTRGLRVPREFAALLVLAIAGLLLQAAFEFPLQIPAVAFQFVLFAAVAATIGTGTGVHRPSG